MKKNIIFAFSLVIAFTILSCNPNIIDDEVHNKYSQVKTGLDVLFDSHLDSIIGKNIALVTNHSGINKDGESNVSLFLNDNRLKLTKIFSPEHGFSGLIADAQSAPHRMWLSVPQEYSTP